MSNKSLKIIFAGTPDFSAGCLDALLSSGYNVVSVLTQPDRPAGRGKRLMCSPVKVLAQKKGINVFQPVSLHSREIQQIISDLKANIMVVAAYKLIFPKAILDIPYFGCINVHGSLLPRWRGAAPIQRSLLAGDMETGVTIIKMNTRLDAGDIIYKLSCPILKEDTSVTLHNKLLKIGQKGLIETLQRITKGEITPEIQNESLVTYAEKITKNEARINWLLPADQIERCVRAFNPWPISWIEIYGKPVKIWQVSVLQTSLNVEPGTIIKVNKKGIQVATIEGILNLESLQLAGKKPMSTQDFLNSHRNWFIPGTLLT